MGHGGVEKRGLTIVGRGVGLALLAGALLAGCGGSGDLDPSTNPMSGLTSPRPPVKVALLAPLSSQGAPGVIARTLKQAAELALIERDTRAIELIVKDDKGTPDGAKAAAEDAIRSGAKLILGPLYAKLVTAMAPVARRAGVPVVAFSTDRQVAGSGIYLMSYQPAPEVERIVAFAAKQGKLRFAALIPTDGFGRLVEPVFTDAVMRAGGTIVALERYPANANALLAPLKKISAAIAQSEKEGAPIDALFLPGGQEYLELLGRLLPMAKIDVRKVKVIGTGGLDYPNAGRDAGLVGAWYPGPDPRGWSEFAQKYAKTYQGAPPRIAGFAYDAVGMAIALAGDAAGKGLSAQALTRAAGFTGIDGAYRLRPDGTTERALAILEVHKFSPTVIEPAPALSAPSSATTAATEKGFSLLKAFQ